MKSSTFPILCTAALVLLPCSVDAKPQTLEAVKIGSRTDVTVNGEFFTSYRFAEDEKYPFFYPVRILTHLTEVACPARLPCSA